MAENVECPQCDGEGCSRWVDRRIACSRCGGRGTVEAWTLSEEEAKEEATRKAAGDEK